MLLLDQCLLLISWSTGLVSTKPLYTKLRNLGATARNGVSKRHTQQTRLRAVRVPIDRRRLSKRGATTRAMKSAVMTPDVG